MFHFVSSAGEVLIKEVSKEGTGAIIKSGVRIEGHVVKRMAERGIAQRMANIAISKGAKFYNPKNETVNYPLKNGLLSGKDLLI